ncbi:MAG: hypothetical protein KKC46_15850 [Proteobacteria bacterium]|nr:hypothetical protein [Pseudomonadota bacterium]
MEKEDVTHKVIGCAYQVYNNLGFGFLESVYRKQLVNYLVATGIEVGLLINFGLMGVYVKRKYRTAKGKQ